MPTGHGTHIAGIVAAKNNGQGVVGVSPGTPVFSLKVLDSKGRGSLANMIAAVQWVIQEGVQQGIRVINLSLAAYIEPASPDYAAVYDAVCSVMQEASDAGEELSVPCTACPALYCLFGLALSSTVPAHGYQPGCIFPPNAHKMCCLHAHQSVFSSPLYLPGRPRLWCACLFYSRQKSTPTVIVSAAKKLACLALRHVLQAALHAASCSTCLVSVFCCHPTIMHTNS